MNSIKIPQVSSRNSLNNQTLPKKQFLFTNYNLESINCPTKTKQKSKYFRAKNVSRLFCLISVLSLITLSCGYSITSIVSLGGKTLGNVYGEAATIPIVKAFLIASLHFGITLGIFISKWIFRLFTRKNLTLILCIISIILLGIIQISNLVVFFISRSLHGIVVGLLLVLIPRYIKEIAPKEITSKPVYVVYRKFYLLFGLVIPIALNLILLKNEVSQFIRWRIVVGMNALPNLIVIISIIFKFIPQSPNSLISKGDEEQAKTTLHLFYQQYCVRWAYAAKVKQVQIIANIHNLPSRQISKMKTFLAFEIPILNQLTGANAYISQMGFVSLAYNPGFSDYVLLIMTIVQVLALLLSMSYVASVTPRTILLVGIIGMSLCCFGIGIGLILIEQFSNAFWGIIVFIIAFMIFNGGTFVPVGGTYIAQIGTRKIIRWSLTANWFASACSIVLFITISSQVGFAPVFFGSGIISLIGFAFNSIFMIQSKPKIKKNASIQLRPLPKNN